MSDHPLVYLASCRARGSRTGGALCASGMLLLGAWWLPDQRWLLAALATGVWPAVFTARAVTALGRRTPELESALQTPAQLVDGLAWWLAARSLPAVALLALAMQAPLVLTLGLLVAYLGILGWVWSDGEDDMLGRLLVALLALTPGLGLLWAGWPGAAAMVALVTLRAGCLVGWRGAGELARAWRRRQRAVPHRLPRWGAGQDDAVLYREFRRAVQRTFLPLALLPLALWAGATSLAAQELSGELLAFSVGVTLLLVQTLRAGWATVGCLADEREQRTLEALTGTRLEAREFVEAWARWGGWPLVLETLVFGALLSGLLPALNLGATLVVVLAGCVGAAYAGVAASADAPRRLLAQDRLGLWLAASFWLPGLLLLLGTALGAACLSPLALWLPWYWRRRAFRALNVHPHVQARLRCLKVKAPPDFKRGLMERLEVEGLVR